MASRTRGCRGDCVVLGDAPKESEAVGEGVLVGVGGTDPVEDGVGGIVPVGVLLGVLEDVLAADGLGVGDVLGGREP